MEGNAREQRHRTKDYHGREAPYAADVGSIHHGTHFESSIWSYSTHHFSASPTYPISSNAEGYPRYYSPRDNLRKPSYTNPRDPERVFAKHPLEQDNCKCFNDKNKNLNTTLT